MNWNKVRQPFQQVWNWLASMHTALILLFILALVTVPGALLPQRSLNKDKVDQYLVVDGKTARIMDKLRFFDVFSTVWFVTTVVLLLISLVGCIIPRTIDHYEAAKTPPAKASEWLVRPLPHDEAVVDTSVNEVSKWVRGHLNKWASTETPADEDRAGVCSFSAEKGYLREFDDLVFHLGIALLTIIVTWGHMAYYGDQVILLTNTGTETSDDNVNSVVGVLFCNTAAASYDSLRSGNAFDGTTLNPFCIQVEDFAANYLPNDQVRVFTSHTRSVEEEDMRKSVDEWEKTILQANHPLRIVGDRIYPQEHNFVPAFRTTWSNGGSHTSIVQFRLDGPTFFLSSGALHFDPPTDTYLDLFERRQNQIAIERLFAPITEFTGEKGALLQSSHPTVQDPAVAVDIYRSDTGSDTGRSQGLFSLDRDLMHSGQLAKETRVNLKRGKPTELASGTGIEFLGMKKFANVQISYDPTQFWALAVILTIPAGMVMSLGTRHRRAWACMFPLDGGRTHVEFGGPARTDKANQGEEFQYIVDNILKRDSDGEDAADQDTADIDAAGNSSDDVDGEGRRVKNQLAAKADLSTVGGVNARE